MCGSGETILEELSGLEERLDWIGKQPTTRSFLYPQDVKTATVHNNRQQQIDHLNR